MTFRRPTPYAPATEATRCMIPDEIHGVRMSHSGDLVEVWHGMDTPAIACGFHATYGPSWELFDAHRKSVSQ